MKKIGLYPWHDSMLKNEVFKIDCRYDLLHDASIYPHPNLTRYLKEQLDLIDVEINTIDYYSDCLEQLDYIFFFDVPGRRNPYFLSCIKKHLEHKMVLFLWEPKAVKRKNYDKSRHKHFSYVFTWDDDLIDHAKYFKFNNPQPSPFKNPYFKPYSEKKFATLISGYKSSKVHGELYSKRLKAVNFYNNEHPAEFDLYGRKWNLHDEKWLRKICSHSLKIYRGTTEDKLLTLSQYKYSFSYENQAIQNGYITEKLFDCFAAGTVPVYWGAPNIRNYVPQECFIDRTKFATEKDLYNYLININEDEYLKLIQAGQAFYRSQAFVPFTDKHFIENIITRFKLN